MARLQAEIARKAGEELRARETSAAARKATFEATERLAEAEEKRLWKNPKLPTPNLQPLNSLLWNPPAKPTLFRRDVLVVTCEDEMPAGAQFQYKISNYRGPLGRVFSLWDDITRNDKGRHGFTLPPGEMKVQVRMITRDNNQVSPESLSYDIVVKGA